MSASIFINYRRDDTGPEAMLVREAVRSEFGNDFVFMDTSSLLPGILWPETIKDGLRRAKTMLAVIGPEWLRAGSDEWGLRRIDQKADWVRSELAVALGKEKRVIPVLVRGAKMPPAKVLPEALRRLPKLQAISLRHEYWDHDIKLLLAQVNQKETVNRGKHQGLDLYPTGFPNGPDAIAEGKLERILRTELPHWERLISPLPEAPGKDRRELFREFKFKSFSAAIQFMSQVSMGCDIATHHPRWENIWKTVRVYLTTWDSAHVISGRDIQLARYFDCAYKAFPGAAQSKKSRASRAG